MRSFPKTYPANGFRYFSGWPAFSSKKSYSAAGALRQRERVIALTGI
jgi:hypothetical protein